MLFVRFKLSDKTQLDLLVREEGIAAARDSWFDFRSFGPGRPALAEALEQCSPNPVNPETAEQ